MAEPTPKAFISYSWSTPTHREQIRGYAERLVGDGVDVILDQWDLSEGQDKYKFMEKMVSDKSVTHVLVFCDKQYAEKADSRKAGVGTESQIMSREIYESVDQKKFIPLVCERKPSGEPYLPTFFQPRIWIDFSAPERVNENWEQLVRALYGKPLHKKPEKGVPPSYLLTDQSVGLPTYGKLAALREALVNNRRTIPLCRQDFLDAAFSFADSLRIRKEPQVESFDEKILEDLRTLLPLRDQFVEWLILETAVSTGPSLEEIVIAFLERLLRLRFKPADVNSWSEEWFDAMRIFVYETFLYAVAVLIRGSLYSLVGSVLKTHYLIPAPESRRGTNQFVKFSEFYGYSLVLDQRNDRLKLRRISPVADLLKERATRKDVSFVDIMQADTIAYLGFVLADVGRWYPVTLIYLGYGNHFPLFVRATQKKHFGKIKEIYDVSSGDDLRAKYAAGFERHDISRWGDFNFHSSVSFEEALNLDALDTLS